MPHLEPTYLRYIYDGLEKGDLHPDNAAALPDGITGLYEAAFEESKPARERQKLLETCAIWALLKKEVSAQFVAEILEVPTQEIVDFIATYSSWFTSPESGKYQLYHERLKVYLLQKLSEQEIAVLHDKLVIRLENAILEQKQDGFELYGLEFLSVHYFTTAMLTGDGKKLISISYDQNHWQRQIKLSKGFEWTKKGLKQVMNWASKFNDEEIIECGLQMVDLYRQEQNDAPQIVALVAEGDIDTALKRIETFGGNDKEGLQRKFILYMLCLMELTLLESKDKPFRKEAIEKILKHFDENIPVDHSILNWDDFFPSYLMFQIACVFANLELNYLIFYDRTDNWDKSWILENIFNCDKQLEVLISLKFNNSELILIVSVLTKHGKIKKALTYISKINQEIYRCEAITNIAYALKNQNKKSEGVLLIQNFLFNISNPSNLNILLKLYFPLIEFDMFKELKQIIMKISEFGSPKDKEELAVLMSKNRETEQAIALSRSINDLKGNQELASYYPNKYDSNEGSALMNIALEFVKQGKLSEAMDLAENINDEKFAKKYFTFSYQSAAQLKIVKELINQGKIEQSLIIANRILLELDKCSALINISEELLRNKNKAESLKILDECYKNTKSIMNNYGDRSNILLLISTQFYKHGQLEVSSKILKESVTYLNEIDNYYYKSSSLILMLNELIKLGNEKEVNIMIRDVLKYIYVHKNNDYIKKAIEQISILLLNVWSIEETLNFIFIHGQQEELNFLTKNIFQKLIINKKLNLTESTQITSSIFINTIKNNFTLKQNDRNHIILLNIALELKRQCRDEQYNYFLNESLNNIKKINNVKKFHYDYILLVNELKKLGDINNTTILLENLCELSLNNKDLLADYAVQFAEIGKINNAMIYAEKCIYNTEWSQSFHIANIARKRISLELAMQGKLEESLKYVELITDNLYHSNSLSYISTAFAKLGLVKEAASAMHKAHTCALDMSFDKEKSIALMVISSELTKQRRLEEAASAMQEALACARDISNYYEKCSVLKDISTELTKQMKLEDALACARSISYDIEKSRALKDISTELTKQMKLEDAGSIMQEALVCALGIRDNDYARSMAIKDISTEMAKDDNWELAESTVINISLINHRYSCWMAIAKNTFLEIGWEYALSKVHNFKNKETKNFYLKGLADNMNPLDCTKKTVLNSCRYYINDIISLEKILQQYALNQLFFENLPEEKIQRINRTLNIQWAIDIKNQLPN